MFSNLETVVFVDAGVRMLRGDREVGWVVSLCVLGWVSGQVGSSSGCLGI